MIKKLFVFVLMPFSKDFDDIYKFGINKTAKSLGLQIQRVDEQIYKENMLSRIYNQIESADIIVADMTGKNPNVFYEVGYAHAKSKPCVLLTSSAIDIPFDLKSYRHIIYDSSIKLLSDQLRKELKSLKKELQDVTQSFETKISLHDKRLFKNRLYAEARLTLKIDFYNHSSANYIEIESIYLYTAKSWLCELLPAKAGSFKLRLERFPFNPAHSLLQRSSLRIRQV